MGGLALVLPSPIDGRPVSLGSGGWQTGLEASPPPATVGHSLTDHGQVAAPGPILRLIDHTGTEWV